MKLLLVNSTYQAVANNWIKKHFDGAKTILYIPYARHPSEYDERNEAVTQTLGNLGFKVVSAHNTSKSPDALLNEVQGVFVSGGNTYRLLEKLRDTNLLDPIRVKVKKGLPYMGSSAGAILACPTIQTGNDMPIVWPRSCKGLDLIPFQINAHFPSADPTSNHAGETREERLLEYVQENDSTVIGLRDESGLSINDEGVILLGEKSARVYSRSKKPFEIEPGSDLNSVLLSLEQKKTPQSKPSVAPQRGMF